MKLKINSDRLWSKLAHMAQFGATPGGGVSRLALSDTHLEARATLMGWASQLGMKPHSDAMGNLFLRYEWAGATGAPPFLMGSHLDSQPLGGKYDGTYGVLAALEVFQTLLENGFTGSRPLEIVDWTNEEGARFAPGVMGSSCFVRPEILPARLAAMDEEGINVGTAVERWHTRFNLDQLPLARPIFRYLELHIEQGPLLEVVGKQIGVVTAIQGIRRYNISAIGESGHAGTVPREMRKDALMAAVRVINYLNSTPAGMVPDIRFTIGKITAFPGSPAVIPARVDFSIDLRHHKQEVIDKMDFVISKLPELNFGPCEVVVKQTADAGPVTFDRSTIELLSEAAVELGYEMMEMVSGAGHDAQCLASHTPSGMIFIPCEKGVSHNEAESISPGDAARGADVALKVAIEYLAA